MLTMTDGKPMTGNLIEPRFAPSLRAFSRTAAVVTFAVGLLVTLGWALGAPTLKSILPGWVTMKANTALCFMLLGMGLWLVHTRGGRIAGRLLGAVAAVVGLLTLGEYIFGWDAGIDQALFTEPAGAMGTVEPGRMAPNTALNFLMLGLATLLVDKRTRVRLYPSGVLASLAGLVGMLAVFGYAYGTTSLSGIPHHTYMAFHTAVGFIIFSAGLMCARPERGLAAVAASESPGGMVLRGMLPVSFVTAFVVGWIVSMGETAGFYESDEGMAIYAVAIVIVIALLAASMALALHRIDEERKQAEQRLESIAQFPAENPSPVLRVGRDGRALYTNPVAEALLVRDGWTPGGVVFQELRDEVEAALRSGLAREFDLLYPDGRVYTMVCVPVPDKAYVNLYGLDTTDRRRAEHEREIAVEFLRLVNETTSFHDLVREATAFFQRQSGCEAVGIRLEEGGDYPYYESRGFPEAFILMENSLWERDSSGNIIRDTIGNPVIACMCGNVISGRFDPSKEFFTEQGSFWTNCTSELLASTTEADREARTRNRCNGEGYESVALIPLYAGERRMGLLQLNDKRQGVFSADAIGQWERLSSYLAVALAKSGAEEALRESETHRREFYRRTIYAATEGKLVIMEKDEFSELLDSPMSKWSVQDMRGFGDMRDEVGRLVLAEGMDEGRIYGFIACVVEAAANAIKHADGGTAVLSRRNGTLFFGISDAGPGIEALTLPDVALTRGYSTAGTMGMGYKVMIEFADKVYLATDSTGTSVGFEMTVEESVECRG